MTKASTTALLLAAAVVLAAPAPSLAQAQTVAAAYSSKTNVGDLLDNAEAKAVLNRYIPEVLADPRIDQARNLPLQGLAQFVPTMTPDLLAKIDSDLAKVSRK